MKPWEKYELLEKYETRGISHGDPFVENESMSAQEWEQKYTEAMDSGDTDSIADMQALEDAYGPGDAVAGGAAGAWAAPTRSIARFLGETAIDPLYEVAIQNARINDGTEKGIYIGRRGMDNLGIDASKDLAGQFSSLIDRGGKPENRVRLEIDDSQATLEGLPVADSWDRFFSKAERERYGRRDPDLQSMNAKQYENYHKFRKEMEDKYNQTNRYRRPLEDMLKHDELYQAYPDMRRTSVFHEPSMGKSGSYQDWGDQIGFGDSSNPESLRGLMLHEPSHAIQFRDNMPLGGTPSDAESAVVAHIMRPVEQSNRRYQDLLMEEQLGDITPAGAAELRTLIEAREKANDLVRGIQSGDFDAHQAYLRLAGEAEARDAAARMDMPKPERSRTSPYSGAYFEDGVLKHAYDNQTNDLPIDDYIIRRGGGGDQMSIYDPVYHGTNELFEKIDPKDRSMDFSTKNALGENIGAFFATNPNHAKDFGSRVIQSRVELGNPKVFKTQDEFRSFMREHSGRTPDKRDSDGFILEEGTWFNRMRETLEELGYDGVVIERPNYTKTKKSDKPWIVAFREDQILEK